MSEKPLATEGNLQPSPEERAKDIINNLMLLIAQAVGWEQDDPPELLDALLNKELHSTFQLLYDELTTFIRNTRMRNRRGGES